MTGATLRANACSVHPQQDGKPRKTSHSNTAKPFTQHLPWCCQHMHEPSWKEYARGAGSQHHEKLYWVFASETKCLRPNQSIRMEITRQLLIQFLILPSDQTLWGHLYVIHHYGLRAWHTVGVQQLLNEWTTQSPNWVLSTDCTQVTINGHGRWKRSVRRCSLPSSNLDTSLSYSYQRGNAGWSTVAHELRPQSQCH